MNVTLLAATELRQGGYDLLPIPDDALDTTDADHLAEEAGRACYQSWSRPNPATAANADYLAHIIEVGHESVLAHASATFYIEGVSRSLTHELVRHRWLSFSQLSQRYVEPGDMKPVYPPAADAQERDRIWRTFGAAVEAYGQAVAAYEAKGLTGKRAREAARALLPNATETRIVVSGNHRAWRDFLRQRLSPHADAEIRALAEALRDELVRIAPATFSDAGAWSQ